MSVFGTLRWPFRIPTSYEITGEVWSLDRSLDRFEGERYFKERNYPEAEHHLALAVAEAETRGHSVPKRVRLRLQLSEAQRRQAQTGDEAFNAAKLSEAEATLRAAIEHAARAADRTGYVLCLDALADVFADQGDFPAVEKVMQDAIRIEIQLPHPDPVRMARRTHRLGIARHKLGRSDDAIPELQKALDLSEQVYGHDHTETAYVISELGAVYRAQENHQLAQQYLR